MADAPITLAAIVGAHGIGGDVRLKLFAESPESLMRHQRLFVGDRALRLLSVKGGPSGAIARFEGMKDRASAEALRGQLLTVPRSELPPLEEGEYYHADLIGLTCETEAGERLGTVVAVENFGAGDIIEIEKPDGKKAMMPLRAGIAVPSGDRIIADPAYLA